MHKQESTFIQLADILVGAISQKLGESSGQKGKIELGDCMTQMLNTAHDNSWQAAEDGYSVSFFPCQKVDPIFS